jgi:D-xylose transport system substrate-binding protein
VVTRDNVKKSIVDDGFWTARQLCTGAYARACEKALVGG